MKSIIKITIQTLQHIILICCMCLCHIGCNVEQQKNQEKESSKNGATNIPDEVIDLTLLQYKPKQSLWFMDDQPYSGYVENYYPTGELSGKFGILNGKKQNQSRKWYRDGHLREIEHYHKGKLHGEKKIWSAESDHTLIAHLNYSYGKAHGSQTKWYATGELYKKLNLEMGKEVGIQQAYRKNGDLYANYEARNGRIFGLKKAALCYELEEENIQYAQ